MDKIRKLKGGSNPFKTGNNTQFTKDQHAIAKINAKAKPKKKKVKLTKGKPKNVFVPFKLTAGNKDFQQQANKDCQNSLGEAVISDWLNKHNFTYEREKKFADLISPITKKHLRFDFYIHNLRTCIEFDGIQHFEYCKDFDGEDKTLYLKRQQNDKFKNTYCALKKLKLIRINHKQFSNIQKILCYKILNQ